MFDVTVTFDNGPEPSVTPRGARRAGAPRRAHHLLRDRQQAPKPRGARLRRAGWLRGLRKYAGGVLTASSVRRPCNWEQRSHRRI
jgi:hypothetical protein